MDQLHQFSRAALVMVAVHEICQAAENRGASVPAMDDDRAAISAAEDADGHGAGVETGAFDPAEDDDQATLAAAGRIPAAGAAGAEDHSGPGGDGAEERLEHCDNGGKYE